MADQSITFSATGLPVDGNNIYAADVNTTLLALINDYNLDIGTNKVSSSVFSYIFDFIYPVGSVYTNASVSTNPATLLGFGTWVAMGSGQVLVGYSSGDSDFGTLAQTGGEKTHTLITAELASHTHTDSGHLHTIPAWLNASGGGGDSRAYFPSGGTSTTRDTGTSTANLSNTGSGTAHNNIQPYIVVYIWKRTA
jgi:hypothetical protein